MSHQPTEASLYLRALARQLAQPYIALPTIRAVLVSGSSAEGVSDFNSDLDLILFYDEVPSEEALAAACEANHGVNRSPIAPRSESGALEHYYVNGVECQFAHETVAAWERDIASVQEKLEIDSPVQKALGGMREVVPLYGDALIQQWQTTLDDYPDALAQAMVERYLTFYRVSSLYKRLATRDATIWFNQIRVELAHSLIGVLAGLNHLYFTPFQFKRVRRFIAEMKSTPHDFADRLEAVFHAEPFDACAQLEALMEETVALVEQQMPQIDTSAVRRRLAWNPQAWTPVPLDS